MFFFSSSNIKPFWANIELLNHSSLYSQSLVYTILHLTYWASLNCVTVFLETFNHFQNILRLFDVLTNFPFTASETMRDYYL